MEQVLAPRFEFKPKNPGNTATPGFDYGVEASTRRIGEGKPRRGCVKVLRRKDRKDQKEL
jgi:hypothetical protein